MYGWIWVGAIALILFLIGMIGAYVTIEMEDEVALSLRILFIRIRLFPKKKKFRIRDYSYKKMVRWRRKQAKKALKKAQKAEKKRLKKEAQAKAKDAEKEASKAEAAKVSLPEKIRRMKDKIEFYLELVKVFFRSFGKHFKIHVAKIHIAVGSDDAAKTALLYGLIAPGVSSVLALLNKATNLTGNREHDVWVKADFESEQILAEMKITFSLRVWHLFAILFAVGWKFLVLKFKALNKQAAEEEAKEAEQPKTKKKKPMKSKKTSIDTRKDS